MRAEEPQPETVLNIHFENNRWLVAEPTSTVWGEGRSLNEAFHDWWIALDDTVMTLSEHLLSPAMEARLAACRALQVETNWPGEATEPGRVDDVPAPDPLGVQPLTGGACPDESGTSTRDTAELGKSRPLGPESATAASGFDS